MHQDQIKGQNQELTTETGGGLENTQIDWDVDSEGNVYNIGGQSKENFADLKDEFKESS